MSSTHSLPVALGVGEPERSRLLLALIEDQWFERKSVRIRPSKLAQALVGFANADGGTIIVGLSDGTVEGTDAEVHRINELRQANLEHCLPPVPVDHSLVPCTTSDGSADHLLRIDVRAGDAVYAMTNDDVFLRVGDETRRLNYQQRQELLYDRGHGSFESRRLDSTFLADLDEELVGQYAAAVDASDVSRMLHARGLASDNALTVAGALLFGEYPQRDLPEAHVRVIRHTGRRRQVGTRQEIDVDQRMEGPIARQIVAARELITRHQPRRRALASSGRFEDLPLVPEEAWLEGLVNAVVHRSYSQAGDHVRVEIFPDRIEIDSPGRFPSVFEIVDPLNVPRYARNPQIARVCADQRFGQELGEGIPRMFEEMRLAGLVDPLYRTSPTNVRLTLSAEPADRALEARLPAESRAITALLRDAGALSTSEVAAELGLSRITARKRLELLREEGLIEWDGKSPKDPRASWKLPDR